jgi:hypothetical protein
MSVLEHKALLSSPHGLDVQGVSTLEHEASLTSPHSLDVQGMSVLERTAHGADGEAEACSGSSSSSGAYENNGFSISVNVFWRHLDAGFYARKDVYGNKDLVQVRVNVRCMTFLCRLLRA